MPMDVFTYSLYHVNTNGKTRDSHRSAISPSLNISLEKKAFAEKYAPDNYFSIQGCRTGSHLHGLDVVWCTYSDDICSVYSKVEVKKTWSLISRYFKIHFACQPKKQRNHFLYKNQPATLVPGILDIRFTACQRIVWKPCIFYRHCLLFVSQRRNGKSRF